MDKLKFENTPVNKNFKFPFNLTEQALVNWLHGLPVEHNYDSCEQLLGVLQTFNTSELTRPQLLIFLPHISAKLDIIVEQLEKNYLDAGFPLEFEEQEKADLVTLTYITVAEIYASLGRTFLEQHIVGSPKDKASVLYLSLQAFGKALLNLAKVYMKPGQGFWLNCYQLYKKADFAGLLEIEIASEKYKGDTINAAFKHILLFELSETRQFRPREMKIIYSALKNLSTQVEIETGCNHDSFQNLYTFNLGQDHKPRLLFALPQQIGADDRYFSPLAAAQNLQQFLEREYSPCTALKSINHSFFKRATQSLDHSQKRKFSRKNEQFSNTGIVGFNHVSSYLFKINNVAKEQYIQKPKRDPRFAGKWDVPDLDLVPIGDESIHQMEAHLKKTLPGDSSITKILQISRELSGNNKVWNPIEIEKNKRVEIIPTGEFQITESSAQGFQGIWKSPEIKVKVGDIFALPTTKGERVEVGLIRRIDRPEREIVSLGIEIIGFESEVVQIFRPDGKEQLYSAILLPGIPALKQPDSIVYDTSDFSAGEFVNIRRGKKNVSCRLNKLINSTAAMSHMELYYTSD